MLFRSIYVSKELARDLAKDSFQVTAYTRLNTDAISSTAILDFSSNAIQNTGIVEEQVMLTEYIAVMSGEMCIRDRLQAEFPGVSGRLSALQFQPV